MANITNVRSVDTPQKSYMWEVDILGLATLFGADKVSTFAKSVTIPQTAVETIVINHKSTRTAHAGRDSSGHTTTITFWDDEAGTIHKMLNLWMDSILNQSKGTQAPRNLYAAQMQIKLKDSEDNSVTQVIDLSKVFPTDIGDITLNYDSSEAIEISATFSFDTKSVS